jgi:hypothetical protein
MQPSPGGKYPGWGTCHPVNLPEGLPHGHAWAELGKGTALYVEGCPRVAARLGCATVDGMALLPATTSGLS